MAEEKSGLTPLEESLCQAYLVSKDKSEALRKSKYKTDGWRPETVNTKAVQLFAKDKIKARVAELLEARSERTKIDADWMLKRLASIDEMDVADLLDDAGNIKPVRDWPKVWRTTISGFDLQEFASGDTETVLRKIKWPDKVKNLELIGKHIDVQAFKEQRELSGSVSLGSVLDELDGQSSGLPE